jgi:hypothetical protein
MEKWSLKILKNIFIFSVKLRVMSDGLRVIVTPNPGLITKPRTLSSLADYGDRNKPGYSQTFQVKLKVFFDNRKRLRIADYLFQFFRNGNGNEYHQHCVENILYRYSPQPDTEVLLVIVPNHRFIGKGSGKNSIHDKKWD